MHTRILGRSGLEVSAIGLGCMTMTGGYGVRPDHDEMIALIRIEIQGGRYPDFLEAQTNL